MLAGSRTFDRIVIGQQGLSHESRLLLHAARFEHQLGSLAWFPLFTRVTGHVSQDHDFLMQGAQRAPQCVFRAFAERCDEAVGRERMTGGTAEAKWTFFAQLNQRTVTIGTGKERRVAERQHLGRVAILVLRR